ncbi:MAG: glycosyltransferase family 4 protein [Microscillaceae bacterium]|nr:glycosyltransferase family 4 protein [Microscillaceae bacterium]MDW8460274.1 glycosyltransferase family 4 protein [Cytophagales bacterium]
MRILILHNQYKQHGGEDTVVESEKTLLQTQGHEVEALFFSNQILASFWDKVRIVPKMFYNRQAAQEVRQKIQRFQPDVLHVHNIFNVASPAVLIEAQKLNVPVVMTLHNYRLLCLNGLFLRKNHICELCRYQMLALSGIKYGCLGNSRLKSAQLAIVIAWHRYAHTWQKYVNKYIALTNFAKQIFVNSSLQIPENQIIVKPNFVPAQPRLPAKERQNYFLFVGRLSPEKGVLTAIEASLQTQIPLHIIGEGELQSKVEQFAQKHDFIRYFGAKPKAEVIAQMQHALALVFPSIWYEGMPMTILEALSCGTPVIASNLESIAEVLTPLFKDYLFAPHQAQELAQKMLFLQNQTAQLQEQISQTAYEVYQKHYSAQKNYEQLLAIYQEVQK